MTDPSGAVGSGDADVWGQVRERAGRQSILGAGGSLSNGEVVVVRTFFAQAFDVTNYML